MKTEKILNDAETVAVFLRALIDKGIPLRSAESLACAYLSSLLITEATRQQPKEPWEGL